MNAIRHAPRAIGAVIAALAIGCAGTGCGHAPAAGDQPSGTPETRAAATPDVYACGSGPVPAVDQDPDEVSDPPPATAAPAAGSVDPIADEPMPAGPVFGDPAAADRHWQLQTQNDCGLVSASMIVGEVTGAAPDEQDIIGVAKSTPSRCSEGQSAYDDSPGEDGIAGHGTCARDIVTVLARYGITAEYTNDAAQADGGLPTGLEALKRYLGNGHEVLAEINSDTLRDSGDDRSNSDHTVFVAAVDTAQNAVYLGDTAGEQTRGETVSIDTFESAWALGGHGMVVTTS